MEALFVVKKSDAKKRIFNGIVVFTPQRKDYL